MTKSPDDQRRRAHQALALAEALLDQIDDADEAEPWATDPDAWRG